MLSLGTLSLAACSIKCIMITQFGRQETVFLHKHRDSQKVISQKLDISQHGVHLFLKKIGNWRSGQ